MMHGQAQIKFPLSLFVDWGL